MPTPTPPSLRTDFVLGDVTTQRSKKRAVIASLNAPNQANDGIGLGGNALCPTRQPNQHANLDEKHGPLPHLRKDPRHGPISAIISTTNTRII
jgi:hypothetical protein